MTLTRIVSLGRFAGSLTLGAALVCIGTGCRQPVPTRPGAPTNPTNSKSTETTPSTTTNVSGEDFAREFLKAVHDGTAKANVLSPAFKQLVAPPVFELEKSVGYSDHSAEIWLHRFKGQTSGLSLGAGYGSGDAIGYISTSPGTMTLRVSRDSGGWHVDWFFATLTTLDAPPPAASGDAGLSTFAAVTFLQALIAKSEALAAVQMTQKLKASLAPPLGSDEARGYNLGYLHSKLTDLRGAATSFRILKSTADSVTAEFHIIDHSRTITLKFAPGPRPWERLVSEYEVK